MVPKPDLSVLIPVYHTPWKVLQRCLLSISAVLQHQHCSAEVSIGLDGAAENSNLASPLRIFTEGKSSPNCRFVIYEFPHGGEAHTRNELLDVAEGEYILFVDADDYIDSFAVEGLLQTLRRQGIDFAHFNHARVYGQNIAEQRFFDQAVVTQDPRMTLGWILSPASDQGTVWGKLFSSRFLSKEHLRFDTTLVNGVDQEFMVRCALKAGKVAAFPLSFARYVYSSTSVVRTYRRTYEAECRETMRKIKSDIEGRGLTSQLGSIWSDYCLDRLLLILMNSVFSNSRPIGDTVRREEMRQLCNSQPFKEALSQSTLKAFDTKRRITLTLLRWHLFALVDGIFRLRHVQLLASSRRNR
jgi:hypothetical protein